MSSKKGGEENERKKELVNNLNGSIFSEFERRHHRGSSGGHGEKRKKESVEEEEEVEGWKQEGVEKASSTFSRARLFCWKDTFSSRNFGLHPKPELDPFHLSFGIYEKKSEKMTS